MTTFQQSWWTTRSAPWPSADYHKSGQYEVHGHGGILVRHMLSRARVDKACKGLPRPHGYVGVLMCWYLCSTDDE